MSHLNKIGYNNIERLHTKEVAKVHQVDPYLNKLDINKITNSNLGDSFTFVFTKGNTKTVSLVNTIMKESDSELIPEPVSVSHPEPISKLQPTETILETNSIIQESKLEYTARQNKIISYLDKISNENTASDGGKLFYKMLDTKLQLEEYKGLQTIINNLNILDNYKNTYIRVIEIFISMLIKEKNKGEKLYKNKDISQLVINLSS